MKKPLLALAILAAFAGSAQAQSVTLYGIVDLGLSHRDRGAGNTLSMASGMQSGSRFGLRGTENLGGGLSALFVLEQGFNANDGTFASAGLMFSRQAFVGLKGGFGTVKLGRQETPMYAAYNKGIDPFARTLAGDMTNLFPIATTSSNTATSRHASNTRTDNTINYSLPDGLGGFYGEIAYTLGGVTGDHSAGRQWGLSLGYKTGPIHVLYAHHDANSAASGAAQINGKSNLIAGVYDFGVAKLHAAWGDDKNNAAAGVARTETNSWMIGASAPFGPHTVMAHYTRKNDRALADADANQVAVGYTYAMSKRTNLYAAYAHTDNETAGATQATVAGRNHKWLQLGIRHTF